MVEMINEVVFADKQKINDKKKTIGLTYSKNNRAANNANVADKLDTSEMDQENANTIEVPLKGGLISYNITDIKGTEVMHYFKKKWAQRQRVSMDITDTEGNKEAYELEMDKQEENEFLKRFVHKVELVIKTWIQKHQNQDVKFSKISILPVDSTSRFNEIFVRKELSKLSINGLPCQIVDPQMIVKDTKNIQRDEDFIQKNSEFYNNDFVLGKPEMGTVNQRVDDFIVKNSALNAVNEKITQINAIVPKLLNFLRNNKNVTQLSTLQVKNLTYYYKKYIDLIRECYQISYTGVVDNKTHTFNRDEILNAIKYSKGPSIDKRSSTLWDLVKPYVRGEVSKIDNKRYELFPLCLWKKSDFEIKGLRNSERLGVKNIYGVNSTWDEKRIQDEINKIKGTILLIFDDNISGGATLSDVCLQCKNLGIQYIIPITFGKMGESNSMKGLVLNTPKDGYNFSTDNNLSIYDGPEKVKRQYVKKSDRMLYGQQLFNKVFQLDEELPTLDILWLDDIREPYAYFAVKRQSGAWTRNYTYYTTNIFNKYKPNFIWVKNLDDFKEYIMDNGMPDMISLYHDIRPRNYYGQHESGADVAQWLVDYCKENNLQMPPSISHSANREGSQRITNILALYKDNIHENKQVIKLTEAQFRNLIQESVTSVIKEVL